MAPQQNNSVSTKSGLSVFIGQYVYLKIWCKDTTKNPNTQVCTRIFVNYSTKFLEFVADAQSKTAGIYIIAKGCTATTVGECNTQRRTEVQREPGAGTRSRTQYRNDLLRR